MKGKRIWLLGLGVLGAIVIALLGHRADVGWVNRGSLESVAIAQSQKVIPTSTPSPKTPALSSPPDTSTPITGFPAVPISPSLTPTPTALPASTAPPLPLGGDYQDPLGRFKIGILKGYKVSPLAGSVLIEAPDGKLAYSVVAKSQPLGNPIGLNAGYDNTDGLTKAAADVFQRGEGFQPGPPRPEAGGGAVIDWTGTLTIASNPQPVGGVILVRSSAKTILLLIVTATQAGADQVPGALSALANSLKAL